MTARLLSLGAVIALALASAGCMSKRQSVSLRTGGEAMPVVDVKPGYVERIALMDRYRLHDEMRKNMMQRPRIWVEEIPDDDVSLVAPPGWKPTPAPAEEEQQTEEAPPAPSAQTNPPTQ